MRVLLIAPYPPPFDARTRAAVDQVRQLRAAGDDVEVLTPTPTAAAHHRELDSWRACASLARLMRGFDRVLVAEELGALPPLRAALRAARAVETWQPSDVPAPARSTTEPGAAWPSDREGAMVEIRTRAGRSGASTATTRDDVGAHIRRVRPLELPRPTSTRPGPRAVQRIVRRLTRWQVDPIVSRVNEMRAVLVEEFETRERRDGR